MNQNTNACMSRRYHLLLCAICSDTYYIISSLAACSLKGMDNVDRSHKDSDLYANSLKIILHVLRPLQFNVSMSF